MTVPNLDKFEAAIAARRATKAATQEFQRIKKATYANDLVPQIQFERKPEDDLIDQALTNLSIVEAYNRWCGKMKPAKRSGQTEGVMISCPIPGHRDSNPSAWANTDKNTWFCGACNTGGDIYDIAAFHLNLPVPGYKTGKQFHDLRRSMVQDLGYVVQRSDDVRVPDNIYKPEPIAEIIDNSPSLEELEAEIFPSLNWRDIVPEDSFVYQYVNACSVDDAAEEYHFWNAMVAVGMAVGRDVSLMDFKPVFGNLLVCLLGKSGDRKSRSQGHLKTLFNMAIPYDHSSDVSKGIKHIQGTASGEALIRGFYRPIYDSASPKLIIDYSRIRGLVEFPELASLIHRTERMGSTLKEVILQFADADERISNSSITNGESFAKHSFASVITTTQPDSLKHLISEEDTGNGFLNRWLFASGTPKKKIPVGGATIDLLDAGVSLQNIHGQLPRMITWSENGLKSFSDHFYTELDDIADKSPILTRLDLLEKKLLLLLAINENLNEIDESTVESMIKMHGYLLSTYDSTARNTVRQSINSEIYNEILRHIQRLTPKFLPYGPTKKNIRDRLARKNWDPAVVQKMFELLSKNDDIEISQGDPGKPGRKADHFKWIS